MIGMHIYQWIDYKIVIKNLIEARKKVNPTCTYQNMAIFMRIQKAYLSQVIKGRRELNTDQLYMACKYLTLGEEESQYLQLSLEYCRSGISERKQVLKNELEKIRLKHAKTDAHIDVQAVRIPQEPDRMKYYLDPYHQIVHIAMAVEKYRQKPQRLVKDLHLSKEKLFQVIESLVKMGIIEVHDDQVSVLVNNIHLPKDAAVFSSWRHMLNGLSTQKLSSASDPLAYNFSVVFASSDETRGRIQAAFLDFLRHTKKLVGASKPERVFQLNFDLFAWTD